MGTALAFFLFTRVRIYFSLTCHPRFRTFEIQAFGHQKTAPQRGFLPKYLFGFLRMAGAEGLEPSARDFGVDVEKA